MHVAVTYDGSSKAAGVQVYVNGEPQPTNVQADTLTATIRTTVPFKIGQRNKTSPLSGATIQDVRVYARQLGRWRSRVAGQVGTVGRRRRAAGKAQPRPTSIALYDWWLTSLDDEVSKAVARRTTRWSASRPTFRPAARSAM